jgi:hypothetical protein
MASSNARAEGWAQGRRGSASTGRGGNAPYDFGNRSLSQTGNVPHRGRASNGAVYGARSGCGNPAEFHGRQQAATEGERSVESTLNTSTLLGIV